MSNQSWLLDIVPTQIAAAPMTQLGPKGKGLPILYLDFDGVLHPENVYFHVRGQKRNGPVLKDRPGHKLFEHCNLLADLLAPYLLRQCRARHLALWSRYLDYFQQA